MVTHSTVCSGSSSTYIYDTMTCGILFIWLRCPKSLSALVHNFNLKQKSGKEIVFHRMGFQFPQTPNNSSSAEQRRYALCNFVTDSKIELSQSARSKSKGYSRLSFLDLDWILIESMNFPKAYFFFFNTVAR